MLVAWQSPVPGGNATFLRLENDGTLAAYRAGEERPVWRTVPVPAEYKRFTFVFDPPAQAAPSLHPQAFIWHDHGELFFSSWTTPLTAAEAAGLLAQSERQDP